MDGWKVYIHLSPRLVWFIKDVGRQDQAYGCACSRTCEFFGQLQQGRCRTSSERQGNGQNHCTGWHTSHALRQLKKTREALFAILRLQAISPQFIERWWHKRCCHNSGVHVHKPAHHGAPKNRVHAGQKKGNFLASAGVNDVPQDRWPTWLVKVSWRHWPVHGLLEAIVADRQGHSKNNRSQNNQFCSRRKMKSVCFYIAIHFEKKDLHEVRRQCDLKELFDHHEIQSFYSVHQGNSFHQHFVHNRLRHRTEQSCNHRTDCSVCSHGHHGHHDVTKRSQIGRKTKISQKQNVAMSQKLFWDAQMYRAECGKIVQLKPALQTWNGSVMEILNTKLTRSCPDDIPRIEKKNWSSTCLAAPSGKYAAQRFWMSLAALVEQHWNAHRRGSSMFGNSRSQGEWMEITIPQFFWSRNWFWWHWWHVACHFFGFRGIGHQILSANASARCILPPNFCC